MINFIKKHKSVRWGIIVLFNLFFIVLLIILLSKPNNENISAGNFVESTTESLSNTDVALQTEISTTQSALETESFIEETTIPETTTKEYNPKDYIDFEAEYPFEIEINRAENFVVIYGINKEGHYNIVYKTFICSTGFIPENTPLGVFTVSDKYRWRLMVDGTYAQYAMRIHGPIMLHSIPYLKASNDTLEYWEYNKLGKPASLGCIRFQVGAIKWIYDNCAPGTTVVVYDNPGEKPPIKLNKLKKLKKSDKKSCWDPSDPDKNNPWKKKRKDK